MLIRNSLLYTPIRPYTNNEWEKLPHVIIMSDKDWNPTVLDCEGEVDNETCFDVQSSFLDSPNDKSFDEVDN